MRVSLPLLALLLTGCVHTQPAPLGSAEGRAAANARAAGRAALLSVDGRRSRPARSLRVEADVTTWFDEKSGELRSVPTDRVSAVAVPRRTAGALRGLAVGIGSGLAAGALASLAEDGRGFFAYSLPQYLGLYGLSGAAVGSVVGLARGERDVWRAAPADALGDRAAPAYGPTPASARFSVR